MSFSYGQPPPKIEGMVSLKVDNLTYRTTPDDLKRVFEKYGEVGDVYIPRDRWSKESRGFAFVRFYDRRDAEDAMDSLDGRVLDGRELRVQLARYGRPDSPQRERRGGGSRRSRSRSPRGRRGGSRSRRRSGSRTRHRSRSATPPRRDRRSRSKSSSRSPPPRSRSNSPSHGRGRPSRRSGSNSS